MHEHLVSTTTLPGAGLEWPLSSSIWGAPAGHGTAAQPTSPLDGTPLQQIHLLDEAELKLLFEPQDDLPIWSGDELPAFARRLHEALEQMSEPLLDAMRRETAFNRADCAEMLQGALDYITGFDDYLDSVPGSGALALPYQAGTQARQIRLVRQPWGTVAIILPQNAFLLVAVTGLLNALATGNRVILRAPLQSARSAALLALAIQNTAPRLAHRQTVSVVLAPSRQFVTALCEAQAPCLLHYMGSSQHAAAILSQAFASGKSAIADGAGNCWVFVDAGFDADQAAQVLSEGALRYNGQTCTSINGAIIHPSLYAPLRERLVAHWNSRRAGRSDEDQIGPLFDEDQAAWCQDQINSSSGAIVCGAGREGNLLLPALIEEPARHSSLLREGLFGPALWIGAGDAGDFLKLWTANRYPLCAGVLSTARAASWWSARLPNLARLTMNGDPSIEHIFEPWGGYPGSGANGVSIWHEKYQRVLAVDEVDEKAEAENFD